MKNYRERLISIYSNEFNQSLENIENNINNIIINNSVLISNPDIQYIINSTDNMYSINQAAVFSSRSALQNLNSQFYAIDNIAIVNKRGGFVVTTTGIYTIENYFKNIYAYTDYPVSYWYEHPAIQNRSKILPPSQVMCAGLSKKKTITPIIFGTSESNLIIYSFDAIKLYDSFVVHKFTPNSLFFMRNTSNDEYISSSANPNWLTETKPISQLTQFSSTNSLINEIKHDNNKYFHICTKERSTLLGYEYSVVIPYSDINDYTHTLLTNLMYFMLMAVLVMSLYALLGSHFLYSPWTQLAKRLSLTSSSKKREYIDLSNISDAISAIISENADLNAALNKSLPLSQQKYIIDILNNVSDGNDEQMNGLIFKHDYFISIVINASFTLPSSILTSEPDNHLLQTELFSALQSVFAADFTAIKIPSSSNYLYLLLNVENDRQKEKIDTKIEEIHQLLSADENYLSIYFGIGNIYQGIDGLKRTHHEALDAIHNTLNVNRIEINNTPVSENSAISNIENVLTNYITAGYTEQTINYLNNIFDTCAGFPYNRCQQIYITIISSLYRISELKGNNVEAIFSNKTELEFLNETLKLSSGEIHSIILQLVYNIIGSNAEVLNKNHDIAKIVEYINEHYNEDLYLDNLAERFNISKKYLSKKINQHLGQPFKTYLTQLRINKAEEMLRGDSVSITDVYMKVGFFNRSTFLRAFKTKTGLTPSEYRALYRKKNNIEEQE